MGLSLLKLAEWFTYLATWLASQLGFSIFVLLILGGWWLWRPTRSRDQPQTPSWSDGEDPAPLPLPEALELLMRLQSAARMFFVECWPDTSLGAQLRFYRMVMDALKAKQAAN